MKSQGSRTYAFRIVFFAEAQLAHLNKTKICEVEVVIGKLESDVIRVAAGALDEERAKDAEMHCSTAIHCLKLLQDGPIKFEELIVTTSIAQAASRSVAPTKRLTGYNASRHVHVQRREN